MGRAPQGARGLKSRTQRGLTGRAQSRPARGAWIEIDIHGKYDADVDVAPRKGRVD